LLLAAAQGVLMGLPGQAEAVTQVHGNSFVDDAMASRPGDQSNLFQTGVNLDVAPPTKKDLKANLNLRFNYVRTDEQELASLSPFGNIGLDLTGETYGVSLQQARNATLGTATQLTETTVSRASVSLLPRDLPRLTASLSRTESKTGSGPATTGDTGLVQADYQYRWLQARAGVTADRRGFGGQGSNESVSGVVGLGGSYEVLPATLLTAGVDLSRFDARSARGAESSTESRILRLNADSRPFSWFGLLGNFTRSTTRFESGSSVLPSTTQQLTDGTATILPDPSLRLAVTVGNRRFDDVQTVRSVDFRILSATFSRALRERILLGANASRSFESDPGQGENITDNVGASAAADVTSRIALRLNVSVSRSENRTFVSARTFNASGTLAERDRLDRDSGGLPAGFTFFDTLSNDLYTKNSPAIGDWSLTSHIEPVVGRFAVNRSLQVSATPTDRMTVSLSYASNASAGTLGVLGRMGYQSVNGSLSYLATRRSSLGFSGTASFPERGSTAYSATAAWSYRFARGHQMNLGYGRQVTAARGSETLSTVAADRRRDTFSATLGLSLRKRTTLDFTYLATQLFREEQTDFFRIRMGHSF